MQDIERFIRGFSRFQQRFMSEPVVRASLRDGQHPSTLVIGCCDSRVDPALLTGCAPGDLFVVRNIANLVPPCTADASAGVSSAIEFAVCGLEVARVVVLGHARCGGIRALMSGKRVTEETDFVARWMRIAEPVREEVLRALPHKHDDARCRAAEQASIFCLDPRTISPFVPISRISLICSLFSNSVVSNTAVVSAPTKPAILGRTKT